MNLDTIFRKLDLEGKDALILLSEENWKSKVSFPSRIIRLLDDKDSYLSEAKAIFCYNNTPLILFFENPSNIDALHKAIWNFNESPIVIISTDNVVSIFNGFSLEKESKTLHKIGDEKNLSDFSYFKLVTDLSWEKYKEELGYKNRVDFYLLKNIEAAQKRMQASGLKRDLANKLLGKVIFIRYLIDRKVKLHFKNESKYWSNSDLLVLFSDSNRVWSFFEYLQDSENGFNGDLFRIDKREFDTIPPKGFEIIRRLLSCEEIETGQRSLFDVYDFSILPVEFISNVYEKFIGKENQENEGAYYTPTFLVDYIVSKTVGKHLAENDSYSCKILDPACGSGIFLVESLRRLIDKYLELHPINNRDNDTFREELKSIAKNNIFGVDSDISAVQVAIFSVYLTLLDYQKPADIEKFKFPNLFNSNFYCNDTFSLTNEFSGIEFDYIIGNPPWKRGRVEKDGLWARKRFPYEFYMKDRTKKEGLEKIICNNEIAQAFVVRSMDFMSDKTQCAFVLTSKILYNIYGKPFRQYILDRLYIDRVFEMAPVRREVFDKSNDKAIAPACVLFYRHANGNNTQNNIVTHISLKPSRFFTLFKIFSILKTDIQKVRQGLLREEDSLWKILVYGSYMDFNFLKRLKGYTSISDYLRNHQAIIKQGLKRVDGNKKIDIKELVGWDFLDLRKEIGQFFISEKHSKWALPQVGYIYRENGKVCKDIFTPPMLLIKETVNTKLESVSAVSTQKLVFTDKITSVKLHCDNDMDIYRILSCLINSSLFAYYVQQHSSTAGIMIEQQVHDEERFAFPFVFDKALISLAKQLEERQESVQAFMNRDSEIVKIKEKMDNIISKAFKMTPLEMDLLSYNKDYVIPFAMRQKGYERYLMPINNKDDIYFKDYIDIFFDRFNGSFSRIGKRVTATLWHTKQFVGIFFKVVPENTVSPSIVTINKQNDAEAITKLIELSSEKLTERLFVQKDVRGFEREGFYVFKPNERRLWHKAIAYLDVNEFADAMLKVKG